MPLVKEEDPARQKIVIKQSVRSVLSAAPLGQLEQVHEQQQQQQRVSSNSGNNRRSRSRSRDRDRERDQKWVHVTCRARAGHRRLNIFYLDGRRTKN